MTELQHRLQTPNAQLFNHLLDASAAPWAFILWGGCVDSLNTPTLPRLRGQVQKDITCPVLKHEVAVFQDYSYKRSAHAKTHSNKLINT